jgi:hypothetical protein
MTAGSDVIANPSAEAGPGLLGTLRPARPVEVE